MRDIDAYPITKVEMLAALDHAALLLNKEVGDSIGNLQPLALRLVREHIEGLPDSTR